MYSADLCTRLQKLIQNPEIVFLFTILRRQIQKPVIQNVLPLSGIL
jgi:hypothetical protein